MSTERILRYVDIALYILISLWAQLNTLNAENHIHLTMQYMPSHMYTHLYAYRKAMKPHACTFMAPEVKRAQGDSYSQTDQATLFHLRIYNYVGKTMNTVNNVLF